MPALIARHVPAPSAPSGPRWEGPPWNTANVERFRRRVLPRAAPQRLVAVVHVVPREAPAGGGAAVDLVERALTEHHHEPAAREAAGPLVEVVVHQATTGQVEPLVEPSSARHVSARRNSELLSEVAPNQPRQEEPANVARPNST